MFWPISFKAWTLQFAKGLKLWFAIFEILQDLHCILAVHDMHIFHVWIDHSFESANYLCSVSFTDEITSCVCVQTIILFSLSEYCRLKDT